MSLILRTNLSRPLTHVELDNNFTYVNIAEWKKNGYKKGQFVLKINGNDDNNIFYCVKTHGESLYDLNNGNFSEVFTVNGVSTRYWVRLSRGLSTNVNEVTFSGTTQTIVLDDGTTFTTDINNLYLTGDQFLNGISNHSFQKITSDDFITTNIGLNTVELANIISGIDVIPTKTNMVVIDLVGVVDSNYVVSLPNILSENESGVTYKIIVKRNNIPSINKFLLLYSKGLDDKYKIYSTSIKTETQDGYFIPLETLESIDIIFDGTDFLVTNITKQRYVSSNAVSYLDLDVNYNNDYIVRNLGELL